MSLEEASERTGIQKARLQAIEKGDSEPTGDEMLIVADVYREPIEFFITNERSASIEKASDLYRMYGATFSPGDRQSIQEFLTLCRMEHEIDVSRIDLTIDDLQELIGVARRLGVDRRLGYGEMASAALARHLRQAVLTDNKRDFRAIGELVDGRLQTTPRLLGWLYLDGGLTDGEVKDVIEQHRKSGGQMAEVYERAHYEACEKRLMQQAGTRART